VSTVGVTGVYKYTIKFVLPGFGPVGCLIKEFTEVDLGGEFEAIVDL